MAYDVQNHIKIILKLLFIQYDIKQTQVNKQKNFQ